MSTQQTCSSTFPNMEQFLLRENVEYLVPNGTKSTGYLVIVPQMRFDCHGYITNWHARSKLDSGEGAINNLFHDITFQLWRPNAEDDRLYTFVGSNVAQFIGENLRAGLTVTEDGTQFFNLTSAPPNEEKLFFKPGDVIGWYIHTEMQSTERALTIVFRHPTSGDPGLRTFDMYSTVIDDINRANTPPPCDTALCSSQTTLISSVIPYVTVEYGK